MPSLQSIYSLQHTENVSRMWTRHHQFKTGRAHECRRGPSRPLWMGVCLSSILFYSIHFWLLSVCIPYLRHSFLVVDVSFHSHGLWSCRKMCVLRCRSLIEKHKTRRMLQAMIHRLDVQSSNRLANPQLKKKQQALSSEMKHIYICIYIYPSGIAVILSRRLDWLPLSIK